jgi:hypothetical protein
MNRKILIIIIGILIVSSCKQKGEIEYSFEKVQISSSDYYLILPSGIVRNQVETYEEGFTQYFIYSDNSYVIILKGGNAELELPKSDNPEIHSRFQTINRIQMVYGNVKSERNVEFDRAFDLMKANGIKKKP